MLTKVQANLTRPWREWAVPEVLAIPKRILALEVFILLGLSLGRSGVDSLISLIKYVSGADTSLATISQQKANLSGINSISYPWYDIASQVSDFVFDLAPVYLAVWLLWNSKTPASQLWFKLGSRVRLIHWTDFARGAGIAATVGGVGVIFYLICHSLGYAVTIGVGDGHGTVRYWVYLLSDSLVNAALEEFVVIGYFLVRLRQLGVGKGKSLTAAALLRGSYHLYQGVWGFVGNFFMGLVFGYLYVRWGRVTPLVIAHFIMDGVAFVGIALLANHVSWVPA